MTEPTRIWDYEQRIRDHPRWDGESSVDWFHRIGIVPKDADEPAEPREPGEDRE